MLLTALAAFVLCLGLGLSVYYHRLGQHGLQESALQSADACARFVDEFLQVSNRLPNDLGELELFLGGTALGEFYEYAKLSEHEFVIVGKVNIAGSLRAHYFAESNLAVRVSVCFEDSRE